MALWQGLGVRALVESEGARLLDGSGVKLRFITMPGDLLDKQVTHLECFSGAKDGEAVTLAFRGAGLLSKSLDVKMGPHVHT